MSTAVPDFEHPQSKEYSWGATLLTISLAVDDIVLKQRQRDERICASTGYRGLKKPVVNVITILEEAVRSSVRTQTGGELNVGQRTKVWRCTGLEFFRTLTARSNAIVEN